MLTLCGRIVCSVAALKVCRLCGGRWDGAIQGGMAKASMNPSSEEGEEHTTPQKSVATTSNSIQDRSGSL